MGNYNINDVEIGDKVFFERVGIPNFDLYWTVIGFSEGMVHVKINEMGVDDNLHIDVNDIRILTKNNIK